MADERVKLICDKITAASAALSLPPHQITEDDRQGIAFLLCLFDSLLPLVVTAVVKEINMQKGAE